MQAKVVAELSRSSEVCSKPDTVEAWGRAANNPVSGWYGLRKGYRGRVEMYMPPLMKALGLAKIEHNARNNRMRAL